MVCPHSQAVFFYLQVNPGWFNPPPSLLKLSVTPARTFWLPDVQDLPLPAPPHTWYYIKEIWLLNNLFAVMVEDRPFHFSCWNSTVSVTDSWQIRKPYFTSCILALSVCDSKYRSWGISKTASLPGEPHLHFWQVECPFTPVRLVIRNDKSYPMLSNDNYSYMCDLKMQ